MAWCRTRKKVDNTEAALHLSFGGSHTQQCSGVTLGPILGSLGCWRLNPGSLQAKQEPYLLDVTLATKVLFVFEYSGFTPVRALGTLQGTGGQIRIGHVQGKPPALSLPPSSLAGRASIPAELWLQPVFTLESDPW